MERSYSKRSNATFFVNAMMSLLDGGKMARRREIESSLRNDDTFTNTFNPSLSRTERHCRSLGEARLDDEQG